jgi:hypothetical protein
MRSMGSKTGNWNPEAPDQNLYVLNHSNDALLKGAAWVKANTTERIPGSPYCRDANGKTLHVEDMATGCGWQLQTARNVQAEMEAVGLAKVDKDRRIWQCADIPLAHQKPQKHGRRKGDQSNSVQSCFSGQVLDSIRGLPPEKYVWVEARCKEYLDWRPKLFSDGMAQIRATDDRLKNSILLGVGIEKPQPAKERKNGRKAPTVQLEFKLLQEPNFVQSYSPNPVQSTDGNSVQPKNGAPIISVFRPYIEEQTTTTADPPPTGGPDDVVVVVDHLLPYGGVSRAAAQKFLGNCRKQAPECTAQDVAFLIDEVGRTINRRTAKNPIAILLKEIPDRIAAYCQAKPAPPAPSREKEIEALMWMATEDPDPQARQYAKAELERLGMAPGSRVKGAGE